jgi:hypothetical protein
MTPYFCQTTISSISKCFQVGRLYKLPVPVRLKNVAAPDEIPVYRPVAVVKIRLLKTKKD